MEDDRLTPYVGRHRGARPGDQDWLEYQHGQWRIPRHGTARFIPRHLCHDLSQALLEMAMQTPAP